MNIPSPPLPGLRFVERALPLISPPIHFDIAAGEHSSASISRSGRRQRISRDAALEKTFR